MIKQCFVTVCTPLKRSTNDMLHEFRGTLAYKWCDKTLSLASPAPTTRCGISNNYNIREEKETQIDLFI